VTLDQMLVWVELKQMEHEECVEMEVWVKVKVEQMVILEVQMV